MSPLDDWNTLSQSERADFLTASSQSLGRLESVLEKDLWVVAVLKVLFTSPFATKITFTGGTSLSKCHNLIDRFSEDIDLIWDVNDLIVGGIAGKSRSAIKNAREYQVQPALEKRLIDLVVPRIQNLLPGVQIEIESTPRAVAAIIKFPSVVSLENSQFSAVKVELYGMGISQPSRKCQVQPYLREFDSEIEWPGLAVESMEALVIFWQKVTIIQRISHGDFVDWKLARHWSDVRDLYSSLGLAKLLDEPLIESIVQWSSKIQNKTGVDYFDINSGKLQLVPKDLAIRETLISGLNRTIASGYYPNNLDVTQLIEDCELIEKAINRHFAILQ